MRELIPKEKLALGKSNVGTFEIPESEVLDNQHELNSEIATAYTELVQANPEYKFILLVNPFNNRVVIEWTRRRWDLFH